MKMVKGYRHTGIICKDLEKSLEFYKDFLGLRVIQDFWDDSEYINKITGIKGANIHMIKLKADDGSIVELLDYVTHPTELLEQEIYNVGACHFAFQVYDIEQALRSITDKFNITWKESSLLDEDGEEQW